MSCFFLGGFTSCKDDDVNGSLPRLFRPINFNADLNKTVVTLSWAAVDSAKSYTLKVSTDSLNFASPVIDTTITKLSVVKELAGQTKFYAKVCANANDTTKKSKFNTLSFKTPAENIFLGYGTSINTGNLYSAYMTDVNTLDIKWTPGANVSHLILTSSDGSLKDSVVISSAEATAGEKIISSLANSNWTVKVYNKKILRGTATGLVEGDIVLKAGDDLPTAITNATAGQVIVLAPGAVFPMGTATYRLSKNTKIRGLSITNRPIVCASTGSSTSASPLGFVDASAIDFVRFENIDFPGYCNNNAAGTKVGYLINNNTATSVKSLSFTNCNIHNFGNTPMRVQGGKNKVDTLTFNGCIITEFGFASGYALVNISKSTDYINNIVITNSTIYNFSYPVISVVQTATTVMNSVTVSNCTFNQTTQNTTSVRVLFNFDYVSLTNGIVIKNCVFGSSGSATSGLKITNATQTVAPVLTGSYYTSDYIDETLLTGVSYSMKGNMTLYSGASTNLWNAPTTGDFTLKDSAFKGKGVAGDLRWY